MDEWIYSMGACTRTHIHTPTQVVLVEITLQSHRDLVERVGFPLSLSPQTTREVARD